MMHRSLILLACVLTCPLSESFEPAGSTTRPDARISQAGISIDPGQNSSAPYRVTVRIENAGRAPLEHDYDIDLDYIAPWGGGWTETRVVSWIVPSDMSPIEPGRFRDASFFVRLPNAGTSRTARNVTMKLRCRLDARNRVAESNESNNVHEWSQRLNLPYVETIPARELTFIPAHTKGDRDYKGNGPRIELSFSLQPYGPQGRNAVSADVFMKAEEWKNGRPHGTTAEGRKRHLLQQFSANTFVLGVESARRFPGPGHSHKWSYVKRGHQWDPFRFSRSVPVAQLRILGDGKGKDAGTRTRVEAKFHPIRVTLIQMH